MHVLWLFCAHSVRSLLWHGFLWRTFRPRGIWREQTLRSKMAAGAPQRPPLTSWRSFPEGAPWRPCRIFAAGVDCVVRRLTPVFYMYMHRQVCVGIYMYYARKPNVNKGLRRTLRHNVRSARARLAWRASVLRSHVGTAYPGRGIDDRCGGPSNFKETSCIFFRQCLSTDTQVILVKC